MQRQHEGDKKQTFHTYFHTEQEMSKVHEFIKTDGSFVAKYAIAP